MKKKEYKLLLLLFIGIGVTSPIESANNKKEPLTGTKWLVELKRKLGLIPVTK